MNYTILSLIILSCAVYGIMLFVFIRNLIKYKYIGSTFLYIGFSFIVCLGFSLYLNLNPLPADPPVEVSPLPAVANSIFDALKMMVVAFDKASITPFIDLGGWEAAFGIVYVISSLAAFLFTSITVVLSFVRMAKTKLINKLLCWFTCKEIHYIFSDPKVDIAKRLGIQLRSKGHIVIMVVSRSSLMTQEGTEYKDSLMGEGFDVWSENLSPEFADYIFRKHYGYLKKHKVFIYGLFSDDDTSINFANCFKKAVTQNWRFKGLVKKYYESESQKDLVLPKWPARLCEKTKIFVTFHESDIDMIYSYIKPTLGILNTLSEYDIISSNFLFDNPINNFIDFDKVDENIDNQNMHVSLVGFGKINQAIFRKQTYSYQLWGDNVNKVHYHLIDIKSEETKETYAIEMNNYELCKPTFDKDMPTPFLYHLTAELDGKDLNRFEVVDNYIQAIVKDENRFNVNGFELFIISVSHTNTNIKLAHYFRKALLSRVSKERLGRTIIFVRISDQEVADYYAKDNPDAVITQKEIEDGYLLNDTNENKILCPIVPFGVNALMSTYVDGLYCSMNKAGVNAQRAYNDKPFAYQQKQWYLNNKKDYLSNTEVCWSIKPKLKLMGLKLVLDKDVSYFTTEDGTKVDQETYLKIKNQFFDENNNPNPKNPVVALKIAQMEHNRWLGTSYFIHKYSLRDEKDFLNGLQKSLDKWKLDLKDDPNAKPSFTTKDDTKTKNVCFTTNKGLEYIRKVVKAKYPQNKDIQEFADNTFYAYDVRATLYLFESLNSNKK